MPSEPIEERLKRISSYNVGHGYIAWDNAAWLIAEVRALRKRVAELESAVESAYAVGEVRFGTCALSTSVRNKLIRTLPRIASEALRADEPTAERGREEENGDGSSDLI